MQAFVIHLKLVLIYTAFLWPYLLLLRKSETYHKRMFMQEVDERMSVPKGAEYELFGRFFKVVNKGQKSFVLAWSLKEWVTSTVSSEELKKKGTPCRIRTYR